MKIGVVGLGLIGGSIALSSKYRYIDCHVYGMDVNSEHLQMAKQLKIIDHQLDETSYEDLDILILSTPVDVAIKLISPLLDKIGPNTLLMDTGSTKRLICRSIANHTKREQFLAAHPIAGTEFSGPKAAANGLFTKQTMIFCETEKTRASLLDVGYNFIEKLQMRVLTMAPEDHDKHIAYVSHLSHISSFMLGKTVMDKEEKSDNVIYQMAGSGFASTVRLAKSNPTTWTSIFKHNQQNILQVLKQYIDKLDKFKSLLENEDFETIREQLEKSNEIKPILKGIHSNHIQ